jgi:hypothetical protein
MGWIGAMVVGLFGVTVVMLVRSASGAELPKNGGGGTPSPGGPDPRASTPDWTDADFAQLYAVAKRLRMNPADLLLVLASESGLRPWAAYRVDEDGKATTDKSGYPYAAGLNQITRAANDALGLTEEQRATIPTWSVSRQIPLIERLFNAIGWTRAGKAYGHAGVVYAANFAPARMSADLGAVLYREGVDGKAYSRNSGFDREKKGYITVGDLVKHLRGVANQLTYRAAIYRMATATGDRSLAPRLPSG